jgi:RHS repeat-associated protein
MIAGSKTTGDTLTVTVYDAALSGGTEAVTYTVLSGDTLSSITSGITSAINADSNLQAIKVSATSSGQIITLKSLSVNPTTYRGTGSTSATEAITVGINTNGIETAAIGGSKTTGDTVTITVYDPGLSGGSKAETYTVQSTDTLTSIAYGLASVINGDSALSAIGVSANSVSTVINLTSQSLNATTYTQSTSGGATETITLGTSTAATQYAYNNVNELTSLSAGGAVKYQAYTNKPLKSTMVNGSAATLNYAENFTGNATLSSGNNSTTASGTDGSNNTVTQTAQVSTKGPSSASLTYDSNGNMTSDGTNTYAWDAENRLIQVTYPGSGNNSQFTYDGFGRYVDIVETSYGNVASTKQIIWCGSLKCEARNSVGSILSQYFSFGEAVSGSNYYDTKDHLGSIRELTNSSGAIEAQYAYDPYGKASQLQGSLSSDFQYAGYYFHAPSGLNLTVARAFGAWFGRWINRDPIGEFASINLYAYVKNSPVVAVDPLGLAGVCQYKWPFGPWPVFWTPWLVGPPDDGGASSPGSPGAESQGSQINATPGKNQSGGTPPMSPGPIGGTPKAPPEKDPEKCEECYQTWAKKQKECGEEYEDNLRILPPELAARIYAACLEAARQEFLRCFYANCK